MNTTYRGFIIERGPLGWHILNQDRTFATLDAVTAYIDIVRSW